VEMVGFDPSALVDNRISRDEAYFLECFRYHWEQNSHFPFFLSRHPHSKLSVILRVLHNMYITDTLLISHNNIIAGRNGLHCIAAIQL